MMMGGMGGKGGKGCRSQANHWGRGGSRLKRCPNWRSNTAAAANGNSQQPSRERQWPRGRTARSCAWVTASNGSSN